MNHFASAMNRFTGGMNHFGGAMNHFQHAMFLLPFSVKKSQGQKTLATLFPQ
jgi:hypothetical protein